MISEESFRVAKEMAEAAGLAAVVSVLEVLWNQQTHYHLLLLDIHGSLEAAARNDKTLTGLLKEGQ
jgi:hypothetical protein